LTTPAVEESENTATFDSPHEFVAQSPSPNDGPVIAWIKNHKTSSIVTLVVVALIAIGSLVPSGNTGEEATGNFAGDSTPLPDETVTETADPDSATENPEPVQTSSPKDRVPGKQNKFIGIVEDAALKAESGNEFAVVNARKQRGRKICALMPALKATNWVGEVEDASTELGGDSGVLMLRLTDDIAAGTWNNSLSDIDANTLIKPSSSLYNKLGNLSEGDEVTFSGRFVRGPDCLEEQSVVDKNGVLTPDFTFRFSSIKQ
jgi:hypothetical protein